MTTNGGDTCTFRDDELVINYHDAVVYGADLKLFETRSAWLNDACIHFFFTWLQHRDERSNDKNSTLTTSSGTIFLDPSVVSFVMNQCNDQEDVDDFLSGNNDFDNVQRMFLPINDLLGSSQWTKPGGGSHWSLLLILIQKHKKTTETTNRNSDDATSYQMWHFDSIKGHNIEAARMVASKFQQILNHSAAKQTLPLCPSASQVTVIDCKTPQQINGYDCGVHVLVAAEILSEIPTTDVTRETCEQLLRSRMTPQTCPEMRLRIGREIRNLHHALG